MNADLQDIVAYSTMMTERGHVPADGPRVSRHVQRRCFCGHGWRRAAPVRSGCVLLRNDVSAVSKERLRPPPGSCARTILADRFSVPRDGPMAPWRSWRMVFERRSIYMPLCMPVDLPASKATNAERSAAAVSGSLSDWLDDEILRCQVRSSRARLMPRKITKHSDRSQTEPVCVGSWQS